PRAGAAGASPDPVAAYLGRRGATPVRRARGVRMDVLTETLRWLNDPLNWTGRQGVLALARTHLEISAAAVAIALVVALPVGLWLGHRGRGATVGVVVANTTRALPTLALLTLLAATGSFGNTATALACAVFAVPPILANAVTGVGGV